MQSDIDRLKAFSLSQPSDTSQFHQFSQSTLHLNPTSMATSTAVSGPHNNFTIPPPQSTSPRTIRFPTTSAISPLNATQPPLAPPSALLPQLPQPSDSRKDSANQSNRFTLTKSPSTDLSILTYLDLSATPAVTDIIASSGRLPKWIQKCSNLQYLIGDGLALTGLDDWVSESLLQLRVLRLPNNQITTWPDHLAKLLPFHQITVIDLEGNPCFQSFCERCPKFALEYSRAAGYISSSSVSKKSKKPMSSRRTSSTADSISSLSPTASSSHAPQKKKSSFFFSKSRKKRDLIEESHSTPTLTVTHSNNQHEAYSDDSSDDEMLTSLAPVMPVMPPSNKVGRHDSVISTTTSGTGHTRLSIQSQEQMHPDKWAQKRIEGTEIEKSKVLLNLLRDVWELATRDIIKFNDNIPPPISRSLSTASSISGHTSFGASPRNSVGSSSSKPVLIRQGSATKLKNSIHSRLNSLEVLEHYLDEESIDLETPKISPPERTQIIGLLTKVVDSEKQYVQRLGELMTIYVQSKKRPAKAAKLFVNIPALYQFHSTVMLDTLQRCFDAYSTRSDPNLDKLAEVFTTHLKELRIYVDYEMAIDDSMRLVQFWKRITAIESKQPSMQYGGAAIPHLVSYRHPDAYITEWIKDCMAHKSHKLNGIADYLHLPVEHLEMYRYLLKKLQHVTPELNVAFKGFEDIYAEIAREKPKAAEQRRMAEFDQIYSLGALLETRRPGATMRYLGDAVILLKSEVRLELPSKTHRTPDVIHYMSGSSPYTVSEDENLPGDNGRPSKSNPVPKVLTKVVHKVRFTLPLYRIIMCNDLVILTDEDKKKVIKILDRRQVSATLPWKYPVRDGAEALPTGDQASLRSRTSSVGTINSTGSGSATPIPSASASASPSHTSSGAVRIMFHDEPVIWYCTLRTFTASSISTARAGHHRNKVQKEPRARMVDMFD